MYISNKIINAFAKDFVIATRYHSSFPENPRTKNSNAIENANTVTVLGNIIYTNTYKRAKNINVDKLY
jgi:hypothetical protein